MNEFIDNDEIMHTFGPFITKIPDLLHTLHECLQSELVEFDHNISRTMLERSYIKDILKIIQKKWTLEICYLLLVHFQLHFNQIKECLPEISNNVLSKRLKELEQKKLIKREEIACHPIRVCYSLTLEGRKFMLLLIPPFLFYSMTLKKKNNY